MSPWKETRGEVAECRAALPRKGSSRSSGQCDTGRMTETILCKVLLGFDRAERVHDVPLRHRFSRSCLRVR